ncbi:M28 family metallopeptidase [Intrasporangium sp.]|uniref:M28 family metallopeptidase n=1 Tax=Intrasporangium sp. TaxID=1925024 RepID=UPI00336549BF
MPFHPSRPVQALGAVVALGVLLGACAAATPAPLPSSHHPTSSSPTPVGTTAPTLTPPVTTPARAFDASAAYRLVERLAEIGPRDAVSTAYRRAANLVADELTALGYTVTKQNVPVPAGTSWGVKVPSGTTVNVVADPPGFDPHRPHIVLGAHLDTVPQAPGAEDNASGVAVLVELARMLRDQPAKLPVRLVAFGAEESRGSGWQWYAFGSRYFVDSLDVAQRKAVRGMVALDRVGRLTTAVPVCHGGRGSTAVADDLRAAATIRTKSCVNRASDHVSFERVGIAAARIGSVPYDQYHSSKDVSRVVDPRQLGRSATVVWTWLRGRDDQPSRRT